MINISSKFSHFKDKTRLGSAMLKVQSMVPTISAYTMWNWLATTDFNWFSASGQFDAAELIRYMITKPQRRQPDQTHLKLLQMSGDVHPNPCPATKYSCPICTRNITSRGVSYKCTKCYGWVHAKCSEILNAAHYRRKSDWTCDACSAPQSQ